MFDALIRFSLKNRLLVVALALAVLGYGLRLVGTLPVDVFPDLNRPTVTVISEAEGRSPEDVERQVTLPLEQVLRGTPGLERLRSQSAMGLSLIFVELHWDENIHLSRQLILERIASVSNRLPRGVEPVLGPISSVMGEILLVGVTSKSGKTTPMELRTLADWVLRPRLLLPGISQVVAIGGEVRQFQVQVDPQKLGEFGVPLEQVEQALRESQSIGPGGFLEVHGQERVVRTVARATSAEQLGEVLLGMKDGFPLTLKQVATVKEGAKPTRGDAGVNGSRAVVLSIQKQPGQSTISLTADLHRVLNDLSGQVPEDVQVVELFRQADFISAAISNVEDALRDGTLLVIVVLIVFLGSLRTTLITLTAIPLSFMVTAIAMKFLGLSINTMSLGGLAIAIGELVDDAIVDVENVHRRLKENAALPQSERRPALKVVFEASKEVRGSIVYATLIVIVVFLPLMQLEGLEGRLFRPLGISYVLAIVASLLVSLSLTPALCSLLLPNASLKEKPETWLVRRIKQVHRRWLEISLSSPRLILSCALALFLVALTALPLMGREFLPSFNEGTVTLSLTAPPGTSLQESSVLGQLAEKLVLQVPEVKAVGRRTGRAEQDEHAEGVNYSELDVDLKRSPRSREEVLDDVRARLKLLPGVTLNVGQPISHRLDHLISGVKAQIAIKLLGPDLHVLREKGTTLAALVKDVPGTVDVQLERLDFVPELDVTAVPVRAARFGLSRGALGDSVSSAVAGRIVTHAIDKERRTEIFLRYPEDVRTSVETLGRSYLSAQGASVPIEQVARLVPSTGPNTVARENGERRIVISANVSGRDLSSVVNELRDRVNAKLELPPGYRWELGGQFQSQEHGMRTVLLLGLFSLFAIVAVLFAHFRSMRIVAQVLLNIPLALIGSVVAVMLSGGVLSMATLIGFITLCGIASRNTIMLISHCAKLAEESPEGVTRRTVIQGSLDRVVPVLMTALTAALALVPLAISGGQPGKELLQPVAAVILGGLVSSTLLDMLVTPTVFFRYGAAALKTAAQRRAQDEVL
jgi:CzcA family heavy metal efflux pump